MSEPMLAEIKAVGFPWCPYGYAFANGALMQIQQNNALYALIGSYFGGDARTTFALPNLQSRVAVGIYTGGSGSNHTHYQIANYGGNEAVSLTISQMPQHNHTAATTVTASTTVTPTTTVTPDASGLSASTAINVLTGVPPASRVNSPAGNLFTLPVVASGGQVNAFAAPGAGTAGTMATGTNGAATTTLSGAVTATANTTATASTTATAITNVANNGANSPFDNRVPFLALNYIIATNGVFPQRN